MSTIKALKTQLGMSATASQNFVFSAESADGTLKISRGNYDGPTTDVITIDSSNNVKGTFSNSSSAGYNGMDGFRNKIINGNFDFWQRGTSSSVAGFKTADRWVNSFLGSSCTMSRQSFTVGQTDVPNNPKYFCRSVVTSVDGSGNYALSLYKVEDVTTLSGKNVTLSFWAKADATKNIAVEFAQVFGAGGSSSVVNIGTTTVSLTNGWSKYTVSASIPSVSGKTIGTNHYLQFSFFYDASIAVWGSRSNNLGQQSGTFDIAQVQLEISPVAGSWEDRPLSMELELCQRYYQTYTGNLYLLGRVTGTGGITRTTSFTYVSEMRVAPTVNTSSFSVDALSGTASGYTVDATTTSLCVGTTGSGFTLGQAALVNCAPGGALLALDAEI